MNLQHRKVSKNEHSPEAAWLSIQRWCAYQERSQYETRQKLKSYGLGTDEAEELLSRLISENYINEERFAKALASGKFRIKQWGRVKIRIELKKHKVSERNLAAALNSISEEDYRQTLRRLIEKRLAANSETAKKEAQQTWRYLVSRGFEPALVSEQMQVILEDNV